MDIGIIHSFKKTTTFDHLLMKYLEVNKDGNAQNDIRNTLSYISHGQDLWLRNVPSPLQGRRAQRKRELSVAVSPAAVVVGVSCLKELRPSYTMAALLVTGRVGEGRRSNYPRVMLIVVSS